MTARASSLGVGRIHAAENDLIVVPKWWRGQGTRPGVIYCHGAGQDGRAPATPQFSGQMDAVNAVGERWPTVATDFGGTHAWGNDTALARVDEVYAWLIGAGSPPAKGGALGPKVVLMGTSMGTLTALNWAKANPGLVAACVFFTPALDLNDIHANNRFGSTATINAAYGGAYVDAAERADHNPAYQATQGHHDGYPIQLWSSSDDPVCIPAIEVAFAANVGANVERHNLGALGHSEAAVDAVDVDAVVDFIAAAL